jgi:jasmonate O-methyltransferase
LANHISPYDIDEHARRERLPVVAAAYARQFRKDFTRFLELRAKELVPEGRMVVSLLGRESDELSTEVSYVWGITAPILGVMASEVHTWFNCQTFYHLLIFNILISLLDNWHSGRV